MCWRPRGEDVSFTDIKIRIPDKKVDQWMWMTSCTGSVRGGFWGFWKKSVESRTGHRTRRVDFGAHRGQTNLRAMGIARDGWGSDKKSQNRKNAYLSPYVEEPLNSRVIKSFEPELRSSKCFSCFGITMFYVYMLWTFYVRFTYPYNGYGTHSSVYSLNHIYPTPPLGQDMSQGQFLSEV